MYDLPNELKLKVLEYLKLGKGLNYYKKMYQEFGLKVPKKQKEIHEKFHSNLNSFLTNHVVCDNVLVPGIYSVCIRVHDNKEIIIYKARIGPNSVLVKAHYKAGSYSVVKTQTLY